jgi:hypothetical protein
VLMLRFYLFLLSLDLVLLIKCLRFYLRFSA